MSARRSLTEARASRGRRRSARGGRRSGAVALAVQSELLVPGRVSTSALVLDRLRGTGQDETDRLLPLLGEVREQARGAREDRTAFTAVTGKPRSSITAAIGIETFIGSGWTSSRRDRAKAKACAVDPVLVRELENLRPWIDQPVDRVAEARHLRPLASTSSATSAPWPRPRPPPAGARTPRVPSTTGPAPRIPAATAPWRDPGRRRASSGRRRWSASSRARRSRRAAGRGRSAAPRSAPRRSAAGGSTR